MTLKYGLIGSGRMGHEHIRNIKLLDGAAITAIADPDNDMRGEAAALAGKNVAVYPDHRDLLANDACDVIVIASPNDTHHAILLDVLKTDIPVLCEKPLCTTVTDCRDVIDRAAGRAAPVWVAMEYRYMPPVQRMLEVVRDGTIGEPLMISIQEHRYPFLPKVGDWNRFSARTGGTLVEKCCHFWDLMRLALGSDPVRVFASAGVDVNHLDERYDGKTPDMIDNAFVTVDFANGARGMLDLCMFSEASYWQESVSVTGKDARVDARVPGPAGLSGDGSKRDSEVTISTRATRAVETEKIHVDDAILAAGDHYGSCYYQHVRFLDMVRAGRSRPEVSLEDGLWSVIVGEAAEQSARTGEVVPLQY